MVNDRLKLAEDSLNEAREYVQSGNPVQGSEKIYKVVEECIKLLAEKNKLPEYKRAEKEGRWWTHLLGSASYTLAKRLKEEKIGDAWARAYDLHVWGFHECKYKVEMVASGLPYAEWILNWTKNSG